MIFLQIPAAHLWTTRSTPKCHVIVVENGWIRVSTDSGQPAVSPGHPWESTSRRSTPPPLESCHFPLWSLGNVNMPTGCVTFFLPLPNPHPSPERLLVQGHGNSSQLRLAGPIPAAAPDPVGQHTRISIDAIRQTQAASFCPRAPLGLCPDSSLLTRRNLNMND